MQSVENPSQEASALPLVAAVGLNWVKKSASEPKPALVAMVLHAQANSPIKHILARVTLLPRCFG